MMKVAQGFLSRSEVEVYIPLKPNIGCLWSAKSDRIVRPISAEEVAAFNRLVWGNCYGRAFASQRGDLERL